MVWKGPESSLIWGNTRWNPSIIYFWAMEFNFRQTPQNTRVLVRLHGNDQLQGNCKRYETQIWKLDFFPYSLVPRKWANQRGAAKSLIKALFGTRVMDYNVLMLCGLNLYTVQYSLRGVITGQKYKIAIKEQWYLSLINASFLLLRIRRLRLWIHEKWKVKLN